MPSIKDVIQFLGEYALEVSVADTKIELTGLVPVTRTAANKLTFVTNAYAMSTVLVNRSFHPDCLVIVEDLGPEFGRDIQNWIRVENARREFFKIANRFFLDSRISGPSGEGSISEKSNVEDSAVLGPGVIIGKSTIGKNTVIGANTVILDSVTIGDNCIIGPNCTIGFHGFGYEREADGEIIRIPHFGGVVIGNRVHIGANTCIDRGTLDNTVVEDDVKIDNLVHIAHNVRIGRGAFIIANSMIGGSSNIGSFSWIAPSVSIINNVTIGDSSMVGLGAVVLRNVASDSTVAGNPAKNLSDAKTDK